MRQPPAGPRRPLLPRPELQALPLAVLQRPTPPLAPRLPATAALPEILESSYPLEADQHETTTTPNPRRTPAILTAALALTCAAAYRLALARPRAKARTRPR